MAAKDDFENALRAGDMEHALAIFNENELDANMKVGKTSMPLGMAIQQRAYVLAEALIAKGAQVNAYVAGRAPIHMAEDAQGVALLAKHGADINAKLKKDSLTFDRGMTMLHIAAYRGNIDVAKALLAAGADLQAKSATGKTPLHVAAARSKDTVEYLVGVGADLSVKDKEGKTPRDLIGEHLGSAHVRTPDAGPAEVAVENAISQAVLPGVEEENEVSKKKQVKGAEEDVQQPAQQVAPVENSISQAPGSSATKEVDAIAPADRPVPKTPEQQQEEDKRLAPGSMLQNGKFVRNDVGEYRRVGETRVALVDEGVRIRMVDKQMDAFQAGIELAKIKNWQAIQVTGTEVFRAEAWYHAKMEGLEVLGYEPNEKDQARLKAGQERMQKELQAKKPMDLVKTVEEESRDKARDAALDKGLGLKMVDADRGRYAGKLVLQTEHHFVQEIGRGTAVVHDKRNFDDLADLKDGKSMRVQYSGGKAKIEPGHDKSHGVGLGR